MIHAHAEAEKSIKNAVEGNKDHFRKTGNQEGGREIC